MVKKYTLLIFYFLFVAHNQLVPSQPNQLYQAVSRGDYDTVLSLLKGGHPVNNSPLSSLHEATEKGFADIVQLLLIYGADPNHPTGENGNTPWHVALQKGHFNIVDMFLEVAIPPTETLIPAIRTGNPDVVKKILDHTKLDLTLLADNFIYLFASKLLAILASEDIDNHDQIAELLFKYGAPAHGFDSNHKVTPLVLSIIHNKWNLFKMLLAHGAHKEIGDLDHNKSPLCVAVERKNIPMVDYLLKLGADPNSEHNQTPTKKRILHHAASGPVEIASLLVAHGALVNATDNLGRTPLHYAVAHNNQPVVQFLLDQQDILVNHQAPGHALVTPLHQAAYSGNSDLITLLLAHGANPNIRNMFGRTAVHDAILSGSIKTLEVLLRAKPDLNIVDNDGQTPLFVAICNKSVQAVNMLLQAGANPNISSKTISPLHKATHLAEYEIMSLLIQYGACVNAQNFLGKTPLHDAILCATKIPEEQHVAIVKMLLKFGADKNAKDHEGATPLFRAAQTDFTQIAQELLDAQADPNIACNTITPLHEASLHGNMQIAENLIHHGAHINAKNYAGRTPLHDAAVCLYYCCPDPRPIMQLLLANNADEKAIDNDGCLAFQYYSRRHQKPFYQVKN